MAKDLTIEEAAEKAFYFVQRNMPSRSAMDSLAMSGKEIYEGVIAILSRIRCEACEELKDMDLSNHKSDDRTVAFVNGLQYCVDVIAKHEEN